ncbi:pLS20_p028 family conjugation system transmembrane protein [Vagococcus carniphilus]|uniref:pLS20_p028 family conjugation system transmembrane protein n=1 Tax=Vagococcus carniphilus TaxID=218144 RepID=UPI0028928F8F|nr:hypothetical protein [Vagococcus carniphilus]MDT2840908.1 hypothetical protein [Vagococcus carniphilus]
MEKDIALQLLLKFEEFLTISDMFGSTMRKIGWGIIKFLMWAVDELASGLNNMTNLLGFANGKEIGGILNQLKPLQGFLLLIAILVAGVMVYFTVESQSKGILLNIMMTLMLLWVVPTIISDSITVLNGVFSEFSIGSNDDMGFKTVKNNVTDIYVLGKKDWLEVDPKEKNFLTEETIKYLEADEIIDDPESVDKDGLLNYKVTNNHGAKGLEVVEMNVGDGMIDKLILALVGEYYYRWKINYGTIFITLIPICGALFISLLRCGRLIIEIAFNRIWASLMAFWDIRTGEKFKATVREIVVGIVTIGVMILMYTIYMSFTTFVIESKGILKITRFFALLGGAWFVFDGPAIIQKTLGVDAGLDKAGVVLAGLSAKMGIDALKGAKNMAGKGVNTAGGLAGFVSGLLGDSNNEKSEKPKFKGEDEKDSKDNKEEKPGMTDTPDDKENEELSNKPQGDNTETPNLEDEPTGETEGNLPESEENPTEPTSNSPVEDEIPHSEEPQEERTGSSPVGDNEGETELTDNSPINDKEPQEKEQQSPVSDNNSNERPKATEKSKEKGDEKEIKSPINQFSEYATSDRPKKQTGLRSAGNTIRSYQGGKQRGQEFGDYLRHKKSLKNNKKGLDDNE